MTVRVMGDSTDVEQRRRWYRTAAWGRIRRAVLQRSPLCEPCLRRGIRRNADTVDHAWGHEIFDWKLRFWTGPFTAMCGQCHSRKTAVERPAAGFRAGLAPPGQPVIGFGRRANPRGAGRRLDPSDRLGPPALPDASPNPQKAFSTGGSSDDE